MHENLYCGLKIKNPFFDHPTPHCLNVSYSRYPTLKMTSCSLIKTPTNLMKKIKNEYNNI